jgi:hypothetical protein
MMMVVFTANAVWGFVLRAKIDDELVLTKSFSLFFPRSKASGSPKIVLKSLLRLIFETLTIACVFSRPLFRR